MDTNNSLKALPADDGKVAETFCLERAPSQETSNVNDAELLRKVDWLICPLTLGCYFLQYLDKTLLNYASAMGILKDAHLTTQDFGILSLVFYLAFLVFEPLHAYLLQKLPVGKYIGAMVCSFGVIMAVTSACKSYGALIAVRILLGACESVLTPGLKIVVSMWFRRDEQPKRIAIWYTGVGASSIVGSLVSFGFQFYHSHVFASWQIMFLVFGLTTVTFGIVVIVFLPDSPATTSRLSPAEREALVDRLQRDQNTLESKQYKRYQLQQCLLDPQTWLLALAATAAAIPNGAVSNFQSIVIHSLGFDSKQTALLQIPGGVIAVASVLFAGWCGSRFNARGLTTIFCSAIGGLLGGGLLAFLPASETAGRLVGNYMTHVLTAVIPCIYSFGSSNTAGLTKKVTMNAILLMANCLGNILGPLTFRNKDAPGFVPAKTTIVAVTASTILLVVVLLAHYKRQNLEREQYAQGVDGGEMTLLGALIGLMSRTRTSSISIDS